jgi:hypothetical protein
MGLDGHGLLCVVSGNVFENLLQSITVRDGDPA